MNFTVPQTSGADVLQTDVTYIPNPLVAAAALSCQLFNGDTLIGTGPCAGNWESATASVPLSGVPLIDFSSIAAGTNAGRVDFVVAGGSWEFDVRGATVAIARVSPPAATPFPTLNLVVHGTVSSFGLVSTSCR